MCLAEGGKKRGKKEAFSLNLTIFTYYILSNSRLLSINGKNLARLPMGDGSLCVTWKQLQHHENDVGCRHRVR